MEVNQMLKLVCEDIELITGIKTVIYDRDRKKIYSCPHLMCDFCKEIRRSPTLAQQCLQCDAYGFSQSTLLQDIYIYHCHMGLIEAIAPITENGRPIGYLMLGQLLGENDRERVHTRINALDSKVDRDALHRFLDAMTETDEQHLRATARILAMSAAYVSLHEWMKQRKGTLAYEIETYIFEHLSEETLNAQSIESVVGLSRTALYKVCKKSFGMGVGQYIQRVRATTAINLLRTTTIPLSHVADQVGLSSAAQLTRLLKAQTGMTAKEIRNQSQ